MPGNHANGHENSLKKKIIRANSCDSRADLSFSLIPMWNALSSTRSEKNHRLRHLRQGYGAPREKPIQLWLSADGEPIHLKREIRESNECTSVCRGSPETVRGCNTVNFAGGTPAATD